MFVIRRIADLSQTLFVDAGHWRMAVISVPAVMKRAGRLRHYEQGSPVSHTRPNSYARSQQSNATSIFYVEENMKQSLSVMITAISVLVSQNAWAQISDGVVKFRRVE
jgi:hypothetical protein